jgi:hypothetical protein
MTTVDILFLCLVVGVVVCLLDQKYGRGHRRRDRSSKKSTG